MRWWSIPLLAALGWFLFTLTPFWALYDLAKAVQAGDTAYVEHHVNFRTLRLSLTKQLTAALRAEKSEAEPRERQRIADAATALALPLAEVLITPRMVVDLLDDGWPQSLELPNAPLEPRAGGEGLRVGSFGRLVEFYAASEMRGFRTVVMGVPPDRPASEQFKIRMRLRNWTWHLIEIEMTESLRERIAASLARSLRPRGGENRVTGGTPALRP